MSMKIEVVGESRPVVKGVSKRTIVAPLRLEPLPSHHSFHGRPLRHPRLSAAGHPQRALEFLHIMRRIVPRRSFIYYVAARPCLSEHARTASLHGLNLGLAPGQTAEASGQLGAVEELTRLGADGAKRGAGLTTNAAAELRATERAVLLGLGPVGSEGVRESTQRGSGVHARSVVDGLCGMMLAGFPMPGTSRESEGFTYEGRYACPRSG